MNLSFVAGLFVFWIVLSATLSPVYLVVGAVASFVIVWINPKGTMHHSDFSFFSALSYGPWLSLRVLKSALNVSRIILSPNLPVAPKLHEHNTPLRSDGELAVLGNSITLTPGTITIEIEPGKLIVHALDDASLDDIKSGTLERKVSGLFKNNHKENRS